jgi:hypothetical protein
MGCGWVNGCDRCPKLRLDAVIYAAMSLESLF